MNNQFLREIKCFRQPTFPTIISRTTFGSTTSLFCWLFYDSELAVKFCDERSGDCARLRRPASSVNIAQQWRSSGPLRSHSCSSPPPSRHSPVRPRASSVLVCEQVRDGLAPQSRRSTARPPCRRPPPRKGAGLGVRADARAAHTRGYIHYIGPYTL
jgi:hypothetical protein